VSRLLNMADPEDANVLRKCQESHATGVRALLNDQEAREALVVLLSKGAQPSHVHGAFSVLFRESKKSR